MVRQRLHLRRFRVSGGLVRLLTVLAALALIWYGVMTILLAVKVSPHTVNDISAYRTIYDRLSSIRPPDITGTDRIIIAAAGVVGFLLLALIAWRSVPRPYRARGPLELSEEDVRGATIVAPRAVERAAEIAALNEPCVVAATGRYGTEEMHVAVRVRNAHAVAQTLEGVRDRVAGALAEHEVPRVPVSVSMVGFEKPKGRELQ